MVLLTSHLILIPIAVIIFLEAGLLMSIAHRKTAGFVLICGIIIMGYGLYFRLYSLGYGLYLFITKRKDSTTLTLTPTQTKLIKFAQYVLFGTTALVVAVFQFSSPRIFKFQQSTSTLSWDKGGILALGNIQLTFKPTKLGNNITKTFAELCLKHFRHIRKHSAPMIYVPGDNFEDLLAAFCDNKHFLNEERDIIKNAEFRNLVTGFQKLSKDNQMNLSEFFEIVAQIVIGGLKVVPNGTRFVDILEQQNWVQECSEQNAAGKTNGEFIRFWCAQVMDLEVNTIQIDDPHLVRKWMMIEDNHPADAKVICDHWRQLAATNAKLKE